MKKHNPDTHYVLLKVDVPKDLAWEKTPLPAFGPANAVKDFLQASGLFGEVDAVPLDDAVITQQTTYDMERVGNAFDHAVDVLAAG